MKISNEKYAELEMATKLSRPTIYKVLHGQETTRANEYVVKLAYLKSLESNLDRDWLEHKIYELNLMLEQL